MDLEQFLATRVRGSTQQRHFFHFSDRKNLPSIGKHGLLSTSELRRLGLFKDVSPGGDTNSQESDHKTGTDQYVCLCFTDSHPMSYVASTGERNLDPVYLPIDPEVIKLPGVMITNAPSNQGGVERLAAPQALDGLDLDVIYTRKDWTNSAIMERLKTARKYEILVPINVARQFIVGGL